jgi:hypothetical protein
MNVEDLKATILDAEGKHTPKYASYLKYQAEYNDKKSKQNEAYREAMQNPQKLHMWPMLGKQYNDDVNEALNTWIVFGFKNEIEKVLNMLTSLGSNTDTLK